MEWEKNAPSYGDMIRVCVDGLYHYGIFSSNEEIWQFGLAPNMRNAMPDSEVEVCKSDIITFMAGSFLEVAVLDTEETKKRNSPSKTVEIAASRAGKRGYSILFNNCEHFVYECMFGVHYSKQSEDFRKNFMNLPTLDVYIAKIPTSLPENIEIYPDERKSEIISVSNLTLKKEKYYVWKLLEYALNRSFGYKISSLNFTKDTHGKWTCNKCKFSLSHSCSVVAVAVSRKDVGVDIQHINRERYVGLENRILTNSERSFFSTLSSDEERLDYLVRAWTSKEAVFKAYSSSLFNPSEIKTDDVGLNYKVIEIDGVRYAISVVNEDITKIRFFDNTHLSDK